LEAKQIYHIIWLRKWTSKFVCIFIQTNYHYFEIQFK
jgi:hypothetical protein